MSGKFTLIYNGNQFSGVKRNSNFREIIYKNKFLNLDDNASTSTDGITWTQIAQIKSVDENSTNLNVKTSFISGSDIIFVQN